MRIVVKSMIAKSMGKEALGAYAYYMTVMVLASAILAFGFRRAITKQIAASKSENDFAPLVVGVMALSIVTSLVLVGIGLSISPYIDLIYVLVLISVGPYTMFEIARATLRGQFDQKREIILAFVGIMFQSACVIAVIFYSNDPYAPVWGLTIANIALSVGISIYFIRRYGRRWQPGQVWESVQSSGFHSLLLLAIPLWITDVIGIIGSQADQFIVQGQLGYSALAEYAAAFTFIGILDQPITVMSRVFLVTFSGGHYNEIDQYKKVSSLNLAFFSVLGFLVYIVSVPLTPIIFTDDYTMVPLLVVILSTSSIFNSVEVLNTSLTIAKDYPQANRDSKIWTTAIYIPLLFLLISRYGVIGAAIGNVLSWGGYAIVHAIYMRRRLPEHAAHTFRELILGTTLYQAFIWTAWWIGNTWVTMLLLFGYLGIGHLIHLWDLQAIPQLVRSLLPKRLSVANGP
jgi:O-antigen/teichoic acid export membrane protein